MTGCASKIITISKGGAGAANGDDDTNKETKRRRTGGDSKSGFGRSGSFTAKPSPEKSEPSVDDSSNLLSVKTHQFLASFASNVIEKTIVSVSVFIQLYFNEYYKLDIGFFLEMQQLPGSLVVCRVSGLRGLLGLRVYFCL